MTARGLQEQGHEVMLFCQSGSPLADWTREDSFPVDRSMNLNRANPTEIWNGIKRFRRAISDFKPDILNPHCPPGHTYFALARALQHASIPLIRTVAEPRAPKSNLLNRYLHERNTNGLIFTTSSSYRRYRESFSLAHVPQATILPGFRADQFAAGVKPLPLHEQLGLRKDCILIGIVARMSPEKGQEVLIEALALLEEDTKSNCHFILTGDDSRQRGMADLLHLARKRGVDNLIAFQDRYQDIRPLITALDIGLITSVRSEAVCRVALEYMSFSKPIISSDVNILPEVVIHGRNGWVYRNRNAQELAQRLREAIVDASERKKRGRAGFDLVHDEFSLELQMRQTLNFCQSVIEAKQPRK
jgi:glycosyltransferase involved in cell wall biosynthesis